jgi:hypothetical protein
MSLDRPSKVLVPIFLALSGCSSLLDLPPAFDDSAGSSGKDSGGAQGKGGTKSIGGAESTTTSLGGASGTPTAPLQGGAGGNSDGTGGVAGGTTAGGSLSGTGGTTAGGSVTGGSTNGGTTATSIASPEIKSFTVAYNKVCSGAVATLKADFSNGTGTVDNSVGAITSGTGRTTAPITVSTTFKLTVTNGKGEKVEASVDVGVLPGGKFTRTGDLLKGRYAHTATLLKDGRVLIAGGVGAYQDAEVYEPNTGKFTSVGKMVDQRSLHTATLLPDDRVLLVGQSAATETFAPKTNTFSASGALKEARYAHSAVYVERLNRVVVFGGWWNGELIARSTAEFFDPATDTNGAFVTSATVQRMPTDFATAVVADGLVLSVGYGNSLSYDPRNGVNGTFWVNDQFKGPSCYNRTQLISLSDGTALLSTTPLQILSGNFGTHAFTQTFSPPRTCPTMTLLQDGRVLITGGTDDNTAAVVDPSARTITATGNAMAVRADHTATLLGNGAVLVAGGQTPGLTNYLNTAELYCPAP